MAERRASGSLLGEPMEQNGKLMFSKHLPRFLSYYPPGIG
jgi:hypothetical protein